MASERKKNTPSNAPFVSGHVDIAATSAARWRGRVASARSERSKLLAGAAGGGGEDQIKAAIETILAEGEAATQACSLPLATPPTGGGGTPRAAAGAGTAALLGAGPFMIDYDAAESPDGVQAYVYDTVRCPEAKAAPNPLSVLPCLSTAFSAATGAGEFLMTAHLLHKPLIAFAAPLPAPAVPVALVLSRPVAPGATVWPYTIGSLKPAEWGSVWSSVAARLRTHARTGPALEFPSVAKATLKRALSDLKAATVAKAAAPTIAAATQAVVIASLRLTAANPVLWPVHPSTAWVVVPKPVSRLFFTSPRVAESITLLWALSSIRSDVSAGTRWNAVVRTFGSSIPAEIAAVAPPTRFEATGADKVDTAPLRVFAPVDCDLPREYVEDAMVRAHFTILLLTMSGSPSVLAGSETDSYYRTTYPTSRGFAAIEDGTGFPAALATVVEVTTWAGERSWEISLVLAIRGWGKTIVRTIIDLAAVYGVKGIMLNTLNPDLVPWYASLGFSALSPALSFEPPAADYHLPGGVVATRAYHNIPMWADISATPMASANVTPPDLLARLSAGESLSDAAAATAAALRIAGSDCPETGPERASFEAVAASLEASAGNVEASFQAAAAARAQEDAAAAGVRLGDNNNGRPAIVALEPMPERNSPATERAFAAPELPRRRRQTPLSAPPAAAEDSSAAASASVPPAPKRPKVDAEGASFASGNFPIPPGAVLRVEDGCFYLVIPLGGAPVSSAVAVRSSSGTRPPPAVPPAPPSATRPPLAARPLSPPPAPQPKQLHWAGRPVVHISRPLVHNPRPLAPASYDDADPTPPQQLLGSVAPANQTLRELADSPGMVAARRSAVSGILAQYRVRRGAADASGNSAALPATPPLRFTME